MVALLRQSWRHHDGTIVNLLDGFPPLLVSRTRAMTRDLRESKEQMSIPIRTSTLILVGLFLAACGPTDTPGSSTAVRDSAGIEDRKSVV